MKRYDLATAAVDRLALKANDVELLVVAGVKNALMPWYYSAADAMLLCSDSEGSPTFVKEAFACNLPVVSTDVGDVSEIMRGIKGRGDLISGLFPARSRRSKRATADFVVKGVERRVKSA